MISAVSLDSCGGMIVIARKKSLTIGWQHMCLVGHDHHHLATLG